MAYPHACCDGRWVAMRKRMGKGKWEWWEKEEGKKEMGDGTVAPAESCANSELLPSPPPILAKLCPSPWAGHNLARRGGWGSGWEGFRFQENASSKIACPKNGQTFPLSWP